MFLRSLFNRKMAEINGHLAVMKDELFQLKEELEQLKQKNLIQEFKELLTKEGGVLDGYSFSGPNWSGKEISLKTHSVDFRLSQGGGSFGAAGGGGGWYDVHATLNGQELTGSELKAMEEAAFSMPRKKQ